MRERFKELIDAHAVRAGGLEERCVPRLRNLLRLFGRHLARLIDFVGEEQDRYFGQVLARFAPPPHQVVKRGAIGRVEYQGDGLRAAIKRAARKRKTLLSPQSKQFLT